MTRNITKFLLLVSLIIIFIGCGSKDNPTSLEKREEKTEKLEAYKAKSFSYEEGEYKLVNSQIIFSGTGENLLVEARMIVDYYDIDGNHIKTRLLHSTTQNGDEEIFIDEPMTILLENRGPENVVEGKELSLQEKDDLKEYILKIFSSNF